MFPGYFDIMLLVQIVCNQILQPLLTCRKTSPCRLAAARHTDSHSYGAVLWSGHTVFCSLGLVLWEVAFHVCKCVCKHLSGWSLLSLAAHMYWYSILHVNGLLVNGNESLLLCNFIARTRLLEISWGWNIELASEHTPLTQNSDRCSTCLYYSPTGRHEMLMLTPAHVPVIGPNNQHAYSVCFAHADQGIYHPQTGCTTHIKEHRNFMRFFPGCAGIAVNSENFLRSQRNITVWTYLSLLLQQTTSTWVVSCIWIRCLPTANNPWLNLLFF